MAEILAVLNNYRRPQNIGAICDRLLHREGRKHVDIIIADNAPDEEHSIASQAASLPIIDVWRWHQNSGPPSRWWPALAWGHKYKYTLLVDDDYRPRRGLAYHLLAQAESLGDRFSAIGRIGRIFLREGDRWKYERKNIDDGYSVDMAGGGEFVLSEFLPAALEFRNLLARAGATPAMLWHDDLILNCGIQRKTEWPSFVASRRWSVKPLENWGYEFNAASGYQETRDDLINLCATLGWRSLRAERWQEAQAP